MLKEMPRYLKVILAIVFLFLAVVVFTVGKIGLNIYQANRSLNKINNISLNDLTRTYTNNNFGFSFNYPTNGYVYESVSDSRLVVFSEVNPDGTGTGYFCDIDMRTSLPSRDKSTETVIYNGLTWTKYKYEIYSPGIPLTPFSEGYREMVDWLAKKGGNKIRVYTVAETEGYCEKIISTFKFIK